MKIKRINLSRKAKILSAAFIVIAGTSSVAAINQFSQTSAEERPVKIIVDDHEKRISTNEQAIQDTNERVNEVETQTATNTETVKEVQKQVVVVEKKAQEAVNTQPAPQNIVQAPQTAPEPVKVINKKLIVKATTTPMQSGFQCDYVLEHGRTHVEYSGVPCRAVGSELENGTMNTFALWNN